MCRVAKGLTKRFLAEGLGDSEAFVDAIGIQALHIEQL
jgi:hypothetical protein